MDTRHSNYSDTVSGGTQVVFMTKSLALAWLVLWITHCNILFHIIDCLGPVRDARVCACVGGEVSIVVVLVVGSK